MALVLAFTCKVSAKLNSDVKSSPLFKASLQQSIARLEGKAEVQPPNTNAAGVLATSSGCVKPNLPWTMAETCSPTVCGGSTCYSTCSASCYGTCNQSTCQSTCASTCQGTCANTCVGGPCRTYKFAGNCYWYYYGTYGNNWAQSPYPCYQNNAGSVNCWFDDESAPGTPISGVNFNNGYYSGSRTRTTTNGGANLQQVAILWVNQYNYSIFQGDIGYWSGPLTPNYVYQGNLVLEEW
ncbi:MAG: hypothetical protein ACYDEE_14715 [Ignavibacteriaceae bacterium]